MTGVACRWGVESTALALCGMPVCGTVPAPTDRGLSCRTKRGRRGPGRSAAEVRTAGRCVRPGASVRRLAVLSSATVPACRFLGPAGRWSEWSRDASILWGAASNAFFSDRTAVTPTTVGKAGAWSAILSLLSVCERRPVCLASSGGFSLAAGSGRYVRQGAGTPRRAETRESRPFVAFFRGVTR